MNVLMAMTGSFLGVAELMRYNRLKNLQRDVREDLRDYNDARRVHDDYLTKVKTSGISAEVAVIALATYASAREAAQYKWMRSQRELDAAQNDGAVYAGVAGAGLAGVGFGVGETGGAGGSGSSGSGEGGGPLGSLTGPGFVPGLLAGGVGGYLIANAADDDDNGYWSRRRRRSISG